MADETPPRARRDIPRRIGRYDILNRVGRGAMGVVYSAFDESMGRSLAIKVLNADLENDPETRRRFGREAQATAALLHPNIITIFDAGEDQGRPYIAMQLLEGWPLAQYMKQRDAETLERKLDLMVQVCEGLAAAHESRIVHRDLKPGNMFVQSDGLLKILDFGVARLLDSSVTMTNAMVGTPDYMSPEQARGDPADHRSDIFSAGAVFYFMLAGRKPFPGPDLQAVLRQVKFEQPAALPEHDAPAELVRIITDAMAKDPLARPQRAQDLLARIVKFRKQFQQGTKKLAMDAGAKYDAVLRLETDVREVANQLEIELPAQDAGVVRTLQGQIPALVERGGAAIEYARLDRLRVLQVVADLAPEQRRLDAVLGGLRPQVEALQQGERAQETGDARTALRLFEHVCTEQPTSRRARRLADACAPVAQEQDARDRRVDELLAGSRTAAERRSWSEAVALAEEAVRVLPGAPRAVQQVTTAQQGFERDQRRRALLREQALERAGVALDEERFADADQAIQEAAAIAPDAQDLVAIRARLSEARAAAAEADRLHHLALDEIRRARAAFRRGRYDEAVAQLRAFAGRHGDPAPVLAELEQLEALRQRIARAGDDRLMRIAALLDLADTHQQRGALNEALAAAREALYLDSTNADASAAVASLHDRLLERRLERAHRRAREDRAHEVEPLLEASRHARDAGYLGLALASAQSAARLAPDQDDVRGLVEELRREMATDDTEPVTLAGDPVDVVAISRPAVPAPAALPDVVAAPEPARRQTARALASLNQWAAALVRGHLPNR